jgi:histidinol dehydrogenase
MFQKVMTHMEVDDAASIKLARYSETQGAFEGMDAHRFAARIRLDNLKS